MGAEWSPTLRSRSPSSPSSQASRHCLTQGSRMEAQSPWSMGGWLWDSSPCLWGLPWERFARLSPHLGDSTTGAPSWLDLSGVPLHHGSQDGMQSLMLPKGLSYNYATALYFHLWQCFRTNKVCGHYVVIPLGFHLYLSGTWQGL